MFSLYAASQPGRDRIFLLLAPSGWMDVGKAQQQGREAGVQRAPARAVKHAGVLVSALPLTFWGTSGKSRHLSVPQFPHSEHISSMQNSINCSMQAGVYAHSSSCQHRP